MYYYFAATGGSVNARMTMGYRHLYGLGVPRSCSASVKYYQMVAEDVIADLTDDSSSMNFIERLRLSDESSHHRTPVEDEDVIHYYEHSAEAGDVGAQVDARPSLLRTFLFFSLAFFPSSSISMFPVTCAA